MKMILAFTVLWSAAFIAMGATYLPEIRGVVLMVFSAFCLGVQLSALIVQFAHEKPPT